MTVVELCAVSKSFTAPAGERRVLDDVDLVIGRGEMVALAGRSGSGKTTLLSLVAGWDRADRGTVTVLGAAQPDRLPWSDLAIVPQALGMLDELTVAENIALPGRLARAAATVDLAGLLARLGLDRLADRHPSEVSLGEQQRAALARAAVSRPAVLLADEPIAHQNTEWAEAMMALLVDLASDGTACLLATHNEVAFRSADRVVYLDGGRLLERTN